MRSFNFLLVALVICALFCCKKKEANQTLTPTVPTVPTVPVYDFTWTSNYPYVNGEFDFKSTAPAGSVFLWNFGDSSTSSDSTPHHSFSKGATYTVSLTINGDIATTIQKKVYVNSHPNYDFKYIGDPWPFGIGDTVYFVKFGASGDSTYLWDFGDGTTSTLSAPYHVYSSAGEYTIKLLINNAIYAYSSYPKISIYTPSANLHLISGVRLWHGINYFNGNPSTLPDRSFSFTQLNSVTITTSDYGGYHVLSYVPDSSHDNVLFFMYGSNVLGFEIPDNQYVYFDYAKDSISFHYRESGGGGLGEPFTNDYFWHMP